MSIETTNGRVAVITGASSGVGAATARALSADGYRVALLARRADRIHALADELGDGAIAIEADVTDRDSLVAAAQRVKDELAGADVLVNNAGVMLLAPFTSEQREEQRRMVEVNLLGAMTATEVFLDQLRDGLETEVALAAAAERVHDLVERQHDRDVVGLGAQARGDARHRLAASLAQEVGSRVVVVCFWFHRW